MSFPRARPDAANYFWTKHTRVEFCAHALRHLATGHSGILHLRIVPPAQTGAKSRGSNMDARNGRERFPIRIPYGENHGVFRDTTNAGCTDVEFRRLYFWTGTFLRIVPKSTVSVVCGNFETMVLCLRNGIYVCFNRFY